jgi:signal peptidase I
LAGTPSTPILAIATGSMVPTFERGTLVLLEKATPDQIHVGTIIAFHVSCLPAPTVHRVYKILVAGPSAVYLTKGDHNPSPDPCDVPYSNVIGRAVVWVPYLGYLILDPLFAAALIVLVVVSMALIRKPRP